MVLINLFPLIKRNNFYLPKVKFRLRSQSSSCRAPNSFVHKPDSCSFEITEMKSSSGELRNNLRKFVHACKILAFNLFDISCSSRCLLLPKCCKPLPRAAGSYELWSLLAVVVIVYPLNNLSREKAYVSLYCLIFKEKKWPNGEEGIHWYDQGTNEEIEIHMEMTTR